MSQLSCLLLTVVLATAACNPSSLCLGQLQVTEVSTSHWSFSELDTAGSMSADGGMLGIAGYGSDAESDIVVESEAVPDPDAAAGPAAEAGQCPFCELGCKHRATMQSRARPAQTSACEQTGPSHAVLLQQTFMHAAQQGCLCFPHKLTASAAHSSAQQRNSRL